jgi:cell shape-determining protein MreC
MKRRESFLPAFFVVLFLCILILFLSLSGSLKSLSSFLEKGTSGIQSITFKIFQKMPFVSESVKVKELKEVNLELLSRVATFEKLKNENIALSDQFKTSYPSSSRLLKANIIGASTFVPGVSVPISFILDKGLKNNVKVGSAVVIKDNLVGMVSKVSANLSEVVTINNSLSSFTAKTQNGAVGIVKGGEGVILSNILLSENVSSGEIVLTKGNINSDGIGIPPDLVVGKITFVEKNPSDLFQQAKIESSVNFINLSTVFVYNAN